MKTEKNKFLLEKRRQKGRKKKYDNSGSHPDRRRKRKSCTKAELRRRVRTDLAVAIEQIAIFNRIDILPEKKAHLEKAVECLEAALKGRGGGHLLRQQYKLCKDTLWDLERGIQNARHQQIEIILNSGQ